MGNDRYQSGFANHFSTECLKGALPLNQNSPQRPPYGLFAEQLSGTAFSSPRFENRRSWLYRIQPSCVHPPFNEGPLLQLRTAPNGETPCSPNQLRWDPISRPTKKLSFLESLITYVTCGDGNQRGSAVHLYGFNRSDQDEFFYNADGELLLVPQEGALTLRTELGILEVGLGEIAVVPRGIRFQVVSEADFCAGYCGENYGANFRLPELGIIGANGLASPRDFLAPVAYYERRKGKYLLTAKFQGKLWQTHLDHSPLDVVAWHGNYYPYKYDLKLFAAINTVTVDHPDPSIFTVLTSPSERPGTANLDFVVFPPRWLVAEGTFRPPYYHRNYMSEFMGLIVGTYDAKPSGFSPGGASLHNCMSGHGPDSESFERATSQSLKPHYLADSLAFMFESPLVYEPTQAAMRSKFLQKDYFKCWSGLTSRFKTGGKNG